MTIAERKAREAYDKINPWRPINEAKFDGTLCELRLKDFAGPYDTGQRVFVLKRTRNWPSGIWQDVHNPSFSVSSPIEWRPARKRTGNHT